MLSVDATSPSQVYDPESNTYFYTDKYTGRQLDSLGFKDCLISFINGGKRTDVIKPITNLLQLLYRGIEKLDMCRFFCSSLLLLYDADVCGEVKVEIRMIDFANVTLYNERHTGPDTGYLYGVRSLCKLFEEINHDFYNEV